MGYKILRTGSFLYRSYQQQVRSFPDMGIKIIRSGLTGRSQQRPERLKTKKKKKGQSLGVRKIKDCGHRSAKTTELLNRLKELRTKK